MRIVDETDVTEDEVRLTSFDDDWCAQLPTEPHPELLAQIEQAKARVKARREAGLPPHDEPDDSPYIGDSKEWCSTCAGKTSEEILAENPTLRLMIDEALEEFDQRKSKL